MAKGKYKIELTENQFWSLQMFIIMYKDKLKEEANAYKKLVEEIKNGNPYNFNEKNLQTFINNEKYYSQKYQTINTIQKYLDEIPF